MNFWYRPTVSVPALLLLPLSGLVWLVAKFKRATRNLSAYSTPVIVVGNLTVGGTGKTPTIVWLVRQLQAQNYKVAVVSRGYKAIPNRSFPILLTDADSARNVGDEPKLIQRKTGAEVVIDPDRNRAVEFLLNQAADFKPDVIVSDDGLQHYRMYRDLEILMVDAQRGFGNGLLLPAGPLREPANRRNNLEFVFAKQAGIWSEKLRLICAEECTQLAANSAGELLQPQSVNLHSAIGNVESFRSTAEALGYVVQDIQSYRDHDLLPLDPIYASSLPVLTTEKDAIKLQVQPDNLYVLPYDLDYGDVAAKQLITRIKEIVDEKNRHHTRSL